MTRALALLLLLLPALALAQSSPNPGPGPVPPDAAFVATGSTTGRTRADRALDPGINIRDLGAVCDGTTDDSAAITAAFAKTTSPVILIPAGTCKIAVGTYTASSNISLIGAGAGKSAIQLPASCTQTGTLLSWVSRSNIAIRDLTLDLNGCSATGIVGALAVTGGSYIRIENVHVINAGTGSWLEVSINGASHGWIDHSYFHANAAQTVQNQAINSSTSFGAVDDWHINDNTMVNTGSLFNGSRLEFCRNNVSGWDYGAAISINPTSSPDAIICDNIIHDSGILVDADGAWPTGIEDWGVRSLVSGNKINTVAGSCIFDGGPNSLISGNQMTGCGKRSDGAGAPALTVGWVSSTQNGNGSTIVGNAVISDGTATTTYGISDSASTLNVYAPVSQNTFAGASGAFQISGQTNLGPKTADNRIVNPCFAIDQRQEGNFVAPSTGYTTDRWVAVASNGGVNYQKITKTFPGCLTALAPRVAVQTVSPAAGFFSLIKTSIEAQDLADLTYGTATAQTLTLDFCVNYPVTGTFSVALSNPNASRAWVNTFTVVAANTNQCFSFQVPGDTAGAISTNPTNAGLTLIFDEGSGSNSATSTLGVWQAGGFTAATGANFMVANAANTIFNMSSVRLYPSLFDQPWAPRTYGEELNRARRYYYKSFASGTKPAQNAGAVGSIGIVAPYVQATNGSIGSMIKLPVQMRVSPTTTTFYSTGVASANCYDTTLAADAGAASAVNISADGFLLKCALTAGSAIGDVLAAQFTLDADF